MSSMMGFRNNCPVDTFIVLLVQAVSSNSIWIRRSLVGSKCCLQAIKWKFTEQNHLCCLIIPKRRSCIHTQTQIILYKMLSTRYWCINKTPTKLRETSDYRQIIEIMSPDNLLRNWEYMCGIKPHCKFCDSVYFYNQFLGFPWYELHWIMCTSVSEKSTLRCSKCQKLIAESES